MCISIFYASLLYPYFCYCHWLPGFFSLCASGWRCIWAWWDAIGCSALCGYQYLFNIYVTDPSSMKQRLFVLFIWAAIRHLPGLVPLEETAVWCCYFAFINFTNKGHLMHLWLVAGWGCISVISCFFEAWNSYIEESSLSSLEEIPWVGLFVMWDWWVFFFNVSSMSYLIFCPFYATFF